MGREISKEAQHVLDEEHRVLSEVLSSLESQRQHYQERSRIESKRARELTAKIVATRRDEEKAMLASDEAVSHALEQRNLDTLRALQKMVTRPYFGRIRLEEDLPNGGTKEIEYKIGFTANPDCRIIDWRRAPISKLFYEYREGDDYHEEIQGIERTGRVTMRHTMEIENSALTRVSCRHGSFAKKGGEWVQVEGAGSAPGTGPSHRLPEVLSLITGEQFQSITSDATSAVLIQGVAGSGKTTVALHRLAWLLHPDQGSFSPQETLILVLTHSLKNYILNSLPTLDLQGARVLTFGEWSASLLRHLLPSFINTDGTVRRASTPTPSGIDRVKRSVALLNLLEESVRSPNYSLPSLGELMVTLLSRYDEILSHDETKLLDRELIEAALARSKVNLSEGVLDASDESLVIRAAELLQGGLPLPDGSHGHLAHIVVDEVQDLSASDLACVLGAVKEVKDVTLVGDVSQRIDASRTFPGWDRLRQFWDEKESVAHYFSLTVSHRSTLPIMKLAEYVQRTDVVTQGRSGRVPIWFRTPREPVGIKAALQWLTTALERYPSALTAVLCRTEADARYALSLLRPTFGESVRLGDATTFSFDAGIIVSDIRQVKGLEFCNVLLWNPSNKSYPREDPLSANLLYVAITRAQENLCITTWERPSALLPGGSSPLVREIRNFSEE